MRKLLLGFVVLATILLCTLAPGTPVNNDPSPAATTAGIHITTPVQHVRTAAPVAALVVSLLVAALVTVLALAGEDTARAALGTRSRVGRSLLWAWSGHRRGPPARA